MWISPKKISTIAKHKNQNRNPFSDIEARFLFTPKEKEAGTQVFALITSSFIVLSDSNSYLAYNPNPRLNCCSPRADNRIFKIWNTLQIS